MDNGSGAWPLATRRRPRPRIWLLAASGCHWVPGAGCGRGRSGAALPAVVAVGYGHHGKWLVGPVAVAGPSASAFCQLPAASFCSLLFRAACRGARARPLEPKHVVIQTQNRGSCPCYMLHATCDEGRGARGGWG
jgi:hypothetical protein